MRLKIVWRNLDVISERGGWNRRSGQQQPVSLIESGESQSDQKNPQSMIEQF
jgi:hypothetical protein